MRFLIVGDLMGASAGQASPVDQRPIVSISIDTFDEVFGRFKPSVALPALGLQAPLAFEALDDFHPDKMFKKVEVFDRFRSLRQRLQDPATFKAAADELRSAAAQPLPTPADSDTVSTGTPEEKTGALLDRLLGTKPRTAFHAQGNERISRKGARRSLRPVARGPAHRGRRRPPLLAVPVGG